MCELITLNYLSFLNSLHNYSPSHIHFCASLSVYICLIKHPNAHAGLLQAYLVEVRKVFDCIRLF